MNKQARLAAKVAAVNNAHKRAKEVWELIAPPLSQFIKKPILKKDETLLAKVANALPIAALSTNNVRAYINVNRYCFDVRITANEPIADGFGCVYFDTHVTIGEIKDGVLTYINEWKDRRTDYTVAEIERKRQVYEETKQLADMAKDALYPFGEYE